MSPLEAAQRAGYLGTRLPYFGAFMVDESQGRYDIQAFCYPEDIAKSLPIMFQRIENSGKSGRIYDYLGNAVAGYVRNT